MTPMTDEMRPDIAAAWTNVSSKVGKKRDIKKLPDYLNGGETVLAMAGGIVARARLLIADVVVDDDGGQGDAAEVGQVSRSGWPVRAIA